MSQTHEIELRPNIANQIEAERHSGYTFAVAVADIIDNSIAARAKKITILALCEPAPTLAILDDGVGMSEDELLEAMRIGAKDPSARREAGDLGRFGMGLKTASFSQCRRLSVISKTRDPRAPHNPASAWQWDLDYIKRQNKWLIKQPPLDDFAENALFVEFCQNPSGTLVVWDEIDRCKKDDFTALLVELRAHLSLVFHRFLEADKNGENGESGENGVEIWLNGEKLEPLDPFNLQNRFTQELETEIIHFDGHEIAVAPFVLPHSDNVSAQEWERYDTAEDYTKSQGFYLYRERRLLVWGTWWGVIKAAGVTQLVRVRLDVTNAQDALWGIDIKKSTANPVPKLREELRRVATRVAKRGKRVITGRGRRKSGGIDGFWDRRDLAGGKICFAPNEKHPLYERVLDGLDERGREALRLYVRALGASLPLSLIRAEQEQNPKKIDQRLVFGADFGGADNSNSNLAGADGADAQIAKIAKLAQMLMENGCPPEQIEKLLKIKL